MPKTLEPGAKAPAFNVFISDEEKLSLKDLKGNKVVLYFYPKDDTPGCTKESIDFTAHLLKFKRAGTTVIGVSKDSIAKHQKFQAKHKLKVILAADEDGKMCEKYGVWVEKNLYGRKYMGIERTTFLIDEKGTIREIWRKVKVAGHAEKVLEATKAL